MIVTRAEVKLFLGITTTDEDAKLDLMLAMCDTNVKQYCRKNFEQASYTEFYSGSGSRMIVLRKTPVQSITNLWLDNNAYYGAAPDPFPANSIFVNGTDYALELDETLTSADGTLSQVVSRAGLVVRVNTIWPELNPAYFPGRLTQEYGPAFGNIKVTYVAGYPATMFPADLKGAVCMLVSAMRRSAVFGGMPLTSESMTDYSYSLSTMPLSKFPEIGSIRQILNRYREIPLGETNASAPGSYGR